MIHLSISTPGILPPTISSGIKGFGQIGLFCFKFVRLGSLDKAKPYKDRSPLD